MSITHAPAPTFEPPPAPTAGAVLSWPPPGLESIQGKLWRVNGTLAAGGFIVVAPLIWALATEQPFWSLGPFEESWKIGLSVTLFGLAVVMLGFASLIQLFRHAARAAEDGYGSITIWEAAADSRRDTGFLIQGRRHFGRFSVVQREGLVRARLWAAFLVLAGTVWLPTGFAIALLLAARGWITETGIWMLPVLPTAAFLLVGGLMEVVQLVRVGVARRKWLEDERGADTSMQGWQSRLASAGDQIALGAGGQARPRGLRWAAIVAGALFLVALVPTLTIAVTGAVGPILANTAVPTFLSVQEMAGGAEVLREYRLDADPAVTPLQAGEALQNLVFVGPTQEPEPMERSPRQRYEQTWFADESFPDPFSETAARDLMSPAFASFSNEERASIQQASVHPAQAEFAVLARAPLADVATGRWSLPFADGATILSLPWPRFDAIRIAGLAHVARAAAELSQGRRAEAETTIRELISAGFLLMDEGPTLIDNLMGVAWINMGGDALEELYLKTGRTAETRQLQAARQAATESARLARVGNTEQDIHTLLRGIPDLVERADALRGLRWEYLATFNILAPCINLQKMVLGPDETYTAWMERAEAALVRMPGEEALFDLARSGAAGAADRAPSGTLPRLLAFTVGSESQPGSCARLVSALEGGTAGEL